MQLSINCLVPVLFVLLAVALLRIVNLPVEYRGRQILAVYLSPVLSVLGIAAAYRQFDRISWIVAAVNEAVSEILPAESGAQCAEKVFAWNVLIVLAYLIIKLILCPIMNIIWADRANMELTCDTWYKYDEDNNAWFLRLRCHNVRAFFLEMSWGVALICAVILILNNVFWRDTATCLKVFPVAALIVVTELYNFFSGFTKPEYLRTVDGEDIRASRLGAYYRLRKIYEELFPSAVLVSHTGNEYAGKAGATEQLARYQESEDHIERIVGEYFSHLKKKDGLFDVDLVSMTNTLLHGQSAVVFHPFYRDLGEYLLLPFVHSLVYNKKCLIIIGRKSLCGDVMDWAEEQLRNYSRTRSLWRVRELSLHEPDCEVGVLSFSQIYDSAVLNANATFFQEVGFVLMIEPSKMMTTSQIGLSIIMEKVDQANYPTFCICDHDIDGMIDTMSHVLKTSITNVVAAPVPRCVYTAMGWDAAGSFKRHKLFDKQTHYLGNGVELAAVALRHQIMHVTWYSAEKVPVRDIRWIAGQYYPQICRYAHLQNQQRSIDERITFSSNLWGSAVKREEFVIAEDEFCNLFAAMRAYLSRGELQSFVNVISESYLLRDYMRYNRQLFMSDPKAVPAVAPHYAKTERNIVLKLILMMACAPVSEDYVRHELNILGFEIDDVYQTFSNLVSFYTFVDDMIITVQNEQELSSDLTSARVLKYSIARGIFDEHFAKTLKNAYFVVEDEAFEKKYIDARLFEHITQIVMPRQLITYDGKLYRVHKMSPSIGCVLHRAADAYTNRYYYKQLRSYRFEEGADIVRTRKVMDIEVATDRRAFSVKTTGYLSLTENHDLRSARIIDLSEDPDIAVFDRSYKNKNVLRIMLPDTDVRIRFTICMLLSEMFRTVFPDAWPYLAVLSSRPEDIEGMLDKFIYRIEGAIDEEVIYVVEDSDLDLGLLEAVDNNLMRFFEIMADYLDWHFEKMRESPAKDPVLSEIEALPEDEKRRISFFSRIAKRIMRLFGVSDEAELFKPKSEKKQPEAESTPANEEQGGADGETGGDSPFEETTEEARPNTDQLVETASGDDMPPEAFKTNDNADEGAVQAEAQPEEQNGTFEQCSDEGESPASAGVAQEEQIVLHTEGQDLFAVDGVPDDLDILMPIKPSRYQKECFLKFGFDEIDARLSIEEVGSYLKVRGWSNNDLTKARRRTEPEESAFDQNAENHCDFCGAPLTGISYERLSDGRTRCNDCSTTAINEVARFRELFRSTEMMMENTFSIKISVSIAIKTSDARTIARQAGRIFVPSTKVAARVLGFAQYKGGRYSLFIENGSPRLAAIDTITHEMTHIWQYLNWDKRAIAHIYAQRNPFLTNTARDLVYEGMAMWASVQLLYAMGETHYARQQEKLVEARRDIYGLGFCLYRDRYDLVRNGETPAFSPFSSYPPLDPAEVRKLFDEMENRVEG